MMMHDSLMMKIISLINIWNVLSFNIFFSFFSSCVINITTISKETDRVIQIDIQSSQLDAQTDTWTDNMVNRPTDK